MLTKSPGMCIIPLCFERDNNFQTENNGFQVFMRNVLLSLNHFKMQNKAKSLWWAFRDSYLFPEITTGQSYSDSMIGDLFSLLSKFCICDDVATKRNVLIFNGSVTFALPDRTLDIQLIQLE